MADDGAVGVGQAIGGGRQAGDGRWAPARAALGRSAAHGGTDRATRSGILAADGKFLAIFATVYATGSLDERPSPSRRSHFPRSEVFCGKHSRGNAVAQRKA